MGKTIIEKILGAHAGKEVIPGEIVDITIDARAARDFGGANVVKNIKDNRLGIDDPAKTFSRSTATREARTRNTRPTSRSCRDFAREQGIRIYDIDAGIGTHLAIDEGLAVPGSTFVSTDSHANILGRHRRLRPGDGRCGYRPRLRVRQGLVQSAADGRRSF